MIKCYYILHPEKHHNYIKKLPVQAAVLAGLGDSQISVSIPGILDLVQRAVQLISDRLGDFSCEHIFAYDWNAMRGYHYLMHIARMLNEMVLHSIYLIEQVKAVGFQAFIQKFREVMIHRELDIARLSLLLKTPGQLRLVYEENWKTSRPAA
jgi:hypothetical protein